MKKTASLAVWALALAVLLPQPAAAEPDSPGGSLAGLGLAPVGAESLARLLRITAPLQLEEAQVQRVLGMLQELEVPRDWGAAQGDFGRAMAAMRFGTSAQDTLERHGFDSPEAFQQAAYNLLSAWNLEQEGGVAVARERLSSLTADFAELRELLPEGFYETYRPQIEAIVRIVERLLATPEQNFDLARKYSDRILAVTQ